MLSKHPSGGPIRFIEIMKRFSRKDDVELTIVTSKMGKEFCKERELKGIFKVTTQEKKIGNVILLYLRRIILAFSVDFKIENGTIFYSTSDFLPDILPAFVYRFKNKNVKWVSNIYHIIPQPVQRPGSFMTNLVSFLAQRLSFQLIRLRSDLIFVLNKGIVEHLLKLGFHKNKIYVTGAGINLAHINQIPRARETEYDACFLSRLHPSKGIFDLIEIWKLVVSKKKNARLAIVYVGPQNLELALLKRITEENLEANLFMLQLSGDDALRVVKSSKVFVFPSHEEGWGIAICEAMACGLPIVAYDLPVYGEIFKQGIITVPLNDVKRFSEEVIELLVDDEKRFELSKKAGVQASKYDWNDVASKEFFYMEKNSKV